MSDTLHAVARLMREENVGIVPVTDAVGRLLGVVTDRDLVEDCELVEL